MSKKRIGMIYLILMTTYFFIRFFSPVAFTKATEFLKYYGLEMLNVMPLIMALTIVIEVWVPKKTISQFLGKDSGIKGNVMALFLGSVSVGPIYAAFPVSVTLYQKGASVVNITVLLCAWAVVKIPMLANELKFIGGAFMATRWLFTCLVILLISHLTAKFAQIHLSKEEKNVAIDPVTCVQCGLCQKKFPQYFSQQENQFHLKASFLALEKDLQVDLIDGLCPVNAIGY